MSSSCFADGLGQVVVYSCHDDVLDFTLLFQQVFFSLVPSFLFVVAFIVRLYFLRHTPPKIDGAWHLGLAKWVMVIAYCSLQLVLLILRSRQGPASVASTIFSLVTGLLILIVSWQEHKKSFRPSAILEIYLVLSSILDAIYIRSLWIRNESEFIRAFAIASLVVKILLLVLESTNKKSWLKSQFKPRSPEELSGFPNRAILYWLNSLLIAGSRKRLKLHDLYPLDKELDPNYLIRSFWQRWQSFGVGKLKALRVTASILKIQLILPVVPRILLIFFTFCQPLLLNELLAVGLSDLSGSRSIEGPYLIVGYAVVFLGVAFSTLFYWHIHYRFLVKMRGVICSAIFTKMLSLSQTNARDLTAVTLMSTEMERILFAFRLIHECWASVLEISTATYLLSRFLGLIPCLVPLLVAILSAICSACLSSAAGKRQSIWTEAVRHRVTTTSTVLSSMKGIKLSGLEAKLSRIIQDLRVKEVAEARQLRWLLVISSSIAFTPVLITPPLTLLAYVFISSTPRSVPETSVLFTSISLMTILNQPLSQLFQMIPNLIAAIRCFSTIDKFLSATPFNDCRVHSETSTDATIYETGFGSKDHSTTKEHGRDDWNDHEKCDFIIEAADIGWTSQTTSLRNLNVRIAKGGLTMIVGPVGSGKSLLCAAFVGEAHRHRGNMRVSPEARNIAFCSQAPWLINGTIRDTVCQYSAFEEAWYNVTLEAVAFLEDLASLPEGDLTTIGPNGHSLSGGQRQRLALARAIYARKPIVILDDVFSALDNATEKAVFDKVLGPRGILRSHSSTIVLATNAIEHLPLADQILALDESGQIAQSGSFSNLVSVAGYINDMFQGMPTGDGHAITPNPVSSTSSTVADQLVTSHQATKEFESFAHIKDSDVYSYYLKAIGIANAIFQLCSVTAYATLAVFPPIVIRWWTSQSYVSNVNGYYLGLYAGLQGCALLALSIFAYHSLITVIAASGTSLHLQALQTVMQASLSFFSSTSVGSILSRFSQDMQLIDTELPISLLNILSSSLLTLGQAIVICTGSPYTAVVLPFMLIPFYVIQKFYLKTSRQLRHMDLDYKEPLYTHFVECSDGIGTLRAFEWSSLAVEKNDVLLQDSQRPFYLLYAIQRWLTFTLDLVVCILAIVIVTLAVTLRAGAGFTGVALVGLMGLNISIKNLVTQWTIFETTIGAVSRLKNLGNNVVKESDPDPAVDPPQDWPTSSHLEVRNLSVSYDNGESFALRNVNISIPPGSKVGICGRTGSGKSTLILALLRLLPVHSGSVRLSDVDITSLPIARLRNAINAVSQDPFFFAGSTRLNLDPAEKHSDERINMLLDRMGLLPLLNARGGLSAPFDPESLSAGQKQLVFFARAVLRSGSLMILDEITSNVDRVTDGIMQQIIREELGQDGRTLLVVSHRVETFFDFDKIIVMAGGQVIDHGAPKDLKKRCSVYNALLRER